MTLHVTATNFRGIRQAELAIDGLTLISGPNAAGKSSLLQAVAAAVSGRTIPLAGLRKADAGALVTTGAANGSVRIAGDDGHAEIAWPSAKAKSEGTPPQATAFAAGLDHLLDHKSRERSQILQRYLGAEPTREDLGAELSGFSAEFVDKVWQRIQDNDTAETSGWDVAHGEAKDKGARLKGQWEQVTGEKYGERKAASWTPDIWDEDLAATSQESLEDTLAREREYLEGLISEQAVSEDERRRLRELADAQQEREQAAKEASETLAERRQEHEEAKRKRDALPPADKNAGKPCPHCGQPVAVVGSGPRAELQQAEKHITEDELKNRRDAVARADGQVENRKRAVAEAERAANDAERKAQEARDAAAKLAELPAEGDQQDSQEVEQARERVRNAEQRLQAFKTYREARQKHQAVQDNAKIVAVLAPDGLRAKKLAEAATAFCRDYVQPFTKAAGWPEVTLDETFTPSLGGRTYALLSESEQYRVRVAIQVAMARLDGSDLVVIDGVEVLDRKGRNGLAKALMKAPTPALMAMTTEDVQRNPPPDLEAKGAGRTYWVDSGIVQPFSAEAKNAA